MTISELITQQILTSYSEIHKDGPKKSCPEEEVLDAILKGAV